MRIVLYVNKYNTLKFIKDKDVIDMLYYLEARVPTEKDIREYKRSGKDKDIKKYISSYSIEDIKNRISELEYKIPLYDEYTRNMYIINKENVYNRVVKQYYRFPSKELISVLKKRYDNIVKDVGTDNSHDKQISEYDTDNTIHYKKLHKEKILKREARKLKLMFEFLDQYNMNILNITYIKIFYYYSNMVGKDITACIRPSFLPHFIHINPYYSRSEIINLALNIGLIKKSDKYYDSGEIIKLCDKIKKNDISADIIMKHQIYIIQNNMIGLAQYYTLQGSYFMNQYLRGLMDYDYRNDFLEDSIKQMWKVIRGTPAFDKEYTVYRFIKNDDHLSDININDTYKTPSFISTTRDPFYQPESYKFGFILLRIKLPAKKKGVALCVESVSNFPEEQEIILPPGSLLKLIRKDDNVPYYHTDSKYQIQVSTRYEFIHIGNTEILLPEKKPFYDDSIVDFLSISKLNSLSMMEKIRYFIDKYVNEIYQFSTIIGDKRYTILTEWYNSIGVYEKFYAAKTDNGFSLYTNINNYISFVIELGESDGKPFMYVNYYFKYSSTPNSDNIKDIYLVDFVSKVANYFDIDKVVIFSEYISCDFKVKTLKESDVKTKVFYGGNYCLDIYEYLKHGKQRFIDEKIDRTIIQEHFSYYDLDRLRNIRPDKILRREDRDDIYQIYMKIYKSNSKNKDNLADLYVWIVDNHCINTNLLVKKMIRIFSSNNPFMQDFYILAPKRYLYNKGLIDYTPNIEQKLETYEPDKNIVIPKNRYRLDSSRRLR